MGRPADDALHAAGAAGALAAHARSGHLQLKDDHVGVLHRPGTTPPWNWHLLWESAHVASVTSSLPHSPAAVPGPLGHWPNEGQPLRRTMIVLMAPADALPGPHHGPDLCQGCARRRAPAAGRLRRRTGAVRGRAARAGGIHRPAAALLVRPAVARGRASSRCACASSTSVLLAKGGTVKIGNTRSSALTLHCRG